MSGAGTRILERVSMSRRRMAGNVARGLAGLLAGAVLVIVLRAHFSELRLDQTMSRAPFFIEGPDERPSETDIDSIELSVLTYNVWALPVWIPGSERDERLPRIPGLVRKMRPDVVALQEALEPRFRHYLTRVLARYDRGEDALCERTTPVFGRMDCTGGLMTLSRLPIAEQSFHPHEPFREMRRDERWARKGILITALRTPLGAVDVVNLHLYAARDSVGKAVRVRQLRRLRTLLDAREARPVLLLGDLNVLHPALSANRDPNAVSHSAYRFVTDSLGFTDVRPDPGPADATYDPESNSYADVWYNEDLGPQIVDYVMFRAPEGFRVEVSSVERVFDGDRTLSDHYGLRAHLVLGRIAPGEGQESR